MEGEVLGLFPPLPMEMMRAITATAAAMPGISHLGSGRPGAGFGGWRFRVSGRIGSVFGTSLTGGVFPAGWVTI